MSKPILSLRNVCKTYHSEHGPVRALDGVSLDIQKGEIFGLLGVNGAGKTTLSSILATLHPATQGSILFNGVSIYECIEQYRMALGFCPQTQNLDPLLNVHENLLFAGSYFLLNKQTTIQRAERLMEELQLTKYKNFDIDELSGGTKQRVLIARALMHNPDIVILDEPTVGLDPDIRRKLWDIIKGLKKQGITVILTTHYLDEAEELSDRVCFLQHGKVKIIETVQTLREQHNMAKLEDIFIQFTNAHN
jgi:ABC-2 type transport system ATP-binding protein